MYKTNPMNKENSFSANAETLFKRLSLKEEENVLKDSTGLTF